MDDWKIFYSWQSDLPNSLNRGFIQDALERVARAIRQDDSITVEPVIDRDTAGVPGSPDIGNTIFGKIDGSQVFACDVSIINVDDKAKPTPNQARPIPVSREFVTISLRDGALRRGWRMPEIA